VYVSANSIGQIQLQLESGICALEAIRRSGLPQRYPEILDGRLKIGIYGRQIKPDTLLKDGDRLEIYRPLALSPADLRKLEAQRRKSRERPVPRSGAAGGD